MKNDIFKKFAIDSEKIQLSWEKQRTEINDRISEAAEPKRRFVLIHRWVDIAALTIICVIAGWFLVNHSIAPTHEVAATEDEFFEGLEISTPEELPQSLVVLNDFDADETDYTDVIDFMAP